MATGKWRNRGRWAEFVGWGEVVVCYLGSHCHGEVVEDGLDGAKGLVVGEWGGRTEGGVAPEELVNVLQEHVDVEGGEDGGELPGNSPQTLPTRKKGSKPHGIEGGSLYNARLKVCSQHTIGQRFISSPSFVISFCFVVTFTIM